MVSTGSCSVFGYLSFKVYRGPERQYRLDGLQPKTDYEVRVCAVRQCADGSGDLVGPFCQGVPFSTLSVRSAAAAQHGGELNSIHPTARWTAPRLTEQHWAIIFLFAFALFAVAIAFVAKQIIDYTAGAGQMPRIKSPLEDNDDTATGGGGVSQDPPMANM